MGLFDFMSMNLNYEDRAIDRFEEGGLVVDTCSVNDSSKPFETGVLHPSYNSGDWIIVELYDSKDDAKTGHNKWVKKMTSKRLPPKLIDISTAEVTNLTDMTRGNNWRTYQRQK